MELADKIHAYYLHNFSELPVDKQFHYASRLSSWNDDEQCQKYLDELRTNIIPENKPVTDFLKDIIENLPNNVMNAAEARAPYFAKYPDVRGLMLALFRVRHMLYIYNVDARRELVAIKPYDELHGLAVKLSQDEDALRILSTYAINYIYLVEHILFDVHSGVINIESMYKLGDIYKIENKDQILLLIYLYTHCIIGESNFYERGVLPDRKQVYIKMLDYMEDLISQNYENINLDNKLEFLVCCRILNFNSKLFDKIYDECLQSISTNGTFLVDTINKAGQTKKTSFADSEHRNVLFIMSTTPYTKS